MANATLSHLGVIDATTDGSWAQDNALFYEQSMAEILAAFDEMNVFKDLHLTRSIMEGKSAAFPATWKANARYHTPGTPVLGSNEIRKNKRVILIDDLLLADAFIDDLEAAKSEWEFRSIYTKQMGQALAVAYDKNVAQVVVKAARTPADITGAPGGSVLNKGATVATDGATLVSAIFEAAQTMDEKDIPETERYVALRPAQFYLAVQQKDALNRDWGGQGSFANASLPLVANMTVVKSNHLPNGVVTTTAGENNDYSGDFSNTVAAAFHRTTAGTVTLKDLALQMSGDDFRIMYQGDLMVAKYAIGHGILRPECAVEISQAV